MAPGNGFRAVLPVAERGPLDKMMKPGIGTYDRFKRMFESSRKKRVKQYLIRTSLPRTRVPPTKT